ncbi:MAG: DUF423 domain-containing protein [Chromatiales bacterium]
MGRLFLIIGSLGGLATVILGAFGAHALEGQLSAQQLTWWHKAVNYQGLHSLALLATGLLAQTSAPSGALKWAGWLFLAGILLFSGSLYALALSGIRSLGMLTPFGGLAFIAGWACLAVAAWRLP